MSDLLTVLYVLGFGMTLGALWALIFTGELSGRWDTAACLAAIWPVFWVGFWCHHRQTQKGSGEADGQETAL